MKKGGNFRTRKFFNYPESFLFCLYSNQSNQWTISYKKSFDYWAFVMSESLKNLSTWRHFLCFYEEFPWLLWFSSLLNKIQKRALMCTKMWPNGVEQNLQAHIQKQPFFAMNFFIFCLLPSYWTLRSPSKSMMLHVKVCNQWTLDNIQKECSLRFTLSFFNQNFADLVSKDHFFYSKNVVEKSFSSYLWSEVDL